MLFSLFYLPWRALLIHNAFHFTFCVLLLFQGKSLRSRFSVVEWLFTITLDFTSIFSKKACGQLSYWIWLEFTRFWLIHILASPHLSHYLNYEKSHYKLLTSWRLQVFDFLSVWSFFVVQLNTRLLLLARCSATLCLLFEETYEVIQQKNKLDL